MSEKRVKVFGGAFEHGRKDGSLCATVRPLVVTEGYVRYKDPDSIGAQPTPCGCGEYILEWKALT